MADEPSLIDFLESHLGEILSGMPVPASHFQVARFADQPIPGALTLCSLGISKHPFGQTSGRRVRQELLFSCYSAAGLDRPETIVAVVGEDVVNRHHALRRGEILGPAGPLFPGSTCEAILCMSPVYWPDELHVWEGSDPPTAFVWLVPITHDEAHYAFENGWGKLEAIFLDAQPDILDLSRPSVLGNGA